MPTSLQQTWASTAWRAEVTQWINGRLEHAGITPTGALEQPRIRFWSTQLTIPTDSGLFWFKENNPGQRFEAALIDELATIAPDHVVVPLAVERQRGWLLSPDQGPTLATLSATDESTWCRVVVDFALLQRRCAEHGAALLAVGLPRLSPVSAPAYVENEANRLSALPVGHPLRLEHDIAHQVLGAIPRLQEAALTLADAPIPLSLEHNDLHHNNTFLVKGGDTTSRFFDFGDAVWAHPFTSLFVTTNVLCEEWNCKPSDPAVSRIQDAYLEVWTDLAPRSPLRRMLEAALLFGPVHRYESWRRLLVHADEQTVAEFGRKTVDWLTRTGDSESG